MRDVASQARTACKGADMQGATSTAGAAGSKNIQRPDEAYISVLQHFVQLLVSVLFFSFRRNELQRIDQLTTKFAHATTPG